MRNDRLAKIPADLFIPPPGLTDHEERQWAKDQRILALAGRSGDELAEHQQRAELTSRPNLRFMLEAAAHIRHQEATAVSACRQITQAEIDAGRAALDTGRP